MKSVAFSFLLAAGAMVHGAAMAQEPPAAASSQTPSTPYTGSESQRSQSGWYSPPSGDLGPVLTRYPVRSGVAALEASDFVRAEKIFAERLRYDGSDVAARFYLGVAKMNLGKWSEAKPHLKSAARELRKLPDPKSHLGVTYAKLGDVAGARAQRDRLVRMSETCRGTCSLAPRIDAGIRMIDEALAETPAWLP